MPRFDVRPESFLYSTAFPVVWGDQDAQGHINHARFLTYFEQARCAFIAEYGLVVRGGDEGPVIAQAECRYRAQVSYPATVRVYLRSTAIRQSVFRMEYAIYNETTGELAADGATLILWVDLRTGRRKTLPEAWLKALRQRS
ncbi:MAG: thioesterase family protein [Candidatus Sumerlaeota bacterium]|nr:thioesterase family protein [Candidatus Sumerlaeota bacterium]